MSSVVAEKTGTVDLALLIKEYKETGSKELRNEIVMQYSYIARTVAIEMRSTYHKYASIDEMVNQGVIALIESVDRFDSRHGVKFSTFAFTKVRGAVIDYVRKQDWLPRRVRQNSIKLNAAYDRLVVELGRTPEREEMAAQMQMTIEEFDKCVYEISGDKMVSYESLLTLVPQTSSFYGQLSDIESSPETKVNEEELHETLVNEIEKLNEQERLVLSMYYYEELTMKEISQVMGVSEQRIGQINRKLITKLRSSLVIYMKG